MRPAEDFFTAFFGQDVEIIWGGPREAIADYARRVPGELQEALDEVRRLLLLDDDDLVSRTEELGSDLAAEGPELRELLEFAVATWSSALATQKPSAITG